MPRSIRTLCLLAVAAILAQSHSFGAADPLSQLDSAAKSYIQAVNDWSYKVGDVAGGERPDLDDRDWKVASPEISWGDGPVAWARKRIVIPERVHAFPTVGSRIALDLNADDGGQVYVNGVLKQRFGGENGHVILTESAKPGETILVAVRMVNKSGPGRLITAMLDIEGIRPISDMARRLTQDYRLAEEMTKLLPEAGTPECRTALSGCLGHVDFTALDRGDTQAFATSLQAAESGLAPFSRLAQQFTGDLVGHAHIDMNWLWLWPETVEVCQNTFGSVTQLMSEYPEFKFSQSQPTTYKAVQDTMPKLFAKIQRYVKEGRWEVTGGTWVENDMNMASGESIVRQILLAKRYNKDNFGVESEVCWQPDTFGHPWTMPQIIKKSGLKYYVFSRCGVGKRVFWWQGADGSRVLAFNTRGYNGAIGDYLPEYTLRTAKETGAKDVANLYGVGDHGGGPTKQDIENVSELRKRAVVPQIKFSSIGEFFRRALSQKRDYPIVDQELNFIFQGCYTTHGDIKLMNRKSENLLPAAEAFAAIASKFGKVYPSDDFRASWQDACFNQFHDIICGSAIHASYDYSRGLFEKLEKQANTDLDSSLKCVVDRIDTRGEGIPVVVFNSLAWSRTDVAEIACPYSEKYGEMYVADAVGRKLPAQRIGDRIIFLARDVPSLGYSTFWLRRGSLPMSPGSGARGSSDSSTCRIENEYLAVEVNRKTGAISSIFDKLANRRVLGAGKSGGVLQALAEAPRNMSAWEIGRIESTTELSKVRVVEPLQLGPVSSSVRIDQMWNTSLFAQDVILYAGVPRLDIHLTADWREVGSQQKGSTMMKVAFPVNVNSGKATFEIPFGSIERKTDGAEVPALKWIDLSGKGYGVSLLNNCKYGHDVNGSTMRLTLLRSSYDPDPKPDVGMHEMTYSVYPHSGDWRKAGTVRRAYELNNPLIANVTNVHKGTFLRTRCFVGIKPNNLIVTAFKKAEDGDGYILRFYESSGSPCQTRVWVDPAFKSWSEVNLVEEPMGKRGGAIGGKTISLPVGKYEIKTLRLR